MYGEIKLDIFEAATPLKAFKGKKEAFEISSCMKWLVKPEESSPVLYGPTF